MPLNSDLNIEDIRGNTMDELKLNIDLKPLNDDQIKEHKFTLNDLWMIQNKDNQIFGPFDTKSLRTYAIKYDYLFESTKVYNLDSETWSDTFSLPQFQRRKPRLVSASELNSNDQYYLLINGQKDGPHTAQQVQMLLDHGEILPSTEISLDNGKTWLQVHATSHFDRRNTKTNQELPFVPTQDILKQLDKTKKRISQIKETEDAIVGLAFIGHGNDKGQTLPAEKHDNNEFADSFPVPEKRSFFKSRLFASLFSLALIAGIFAYNSSNHINDIKDSIREAKTDTKGINDASRSSRKPASINKFKRNNDRPVKRIKKIIPKKYVKPKFQEFEENAKADIFEQDIENLDINDPEIQEELTRQLAGEYNELDGEEVDELDYNESAEEIFEEEFPAEEY